MKKIFITIIVILALGLVLASNSHTSKFIKSLGVTYHKGLEIEPETILPGDPVFITIDSTSTPVSVLWDNKTLKLFAYYNTPRALVPIDFNEKVLDHTVTVALQNGETLTQKIRITPRPKVERPLGIPEKLGGNTPAAATNLVNNLAKENAVLNSIKSASTTLWSAAFAYPLKTIFVTDDYGYNRSTVGETVVHKGTDFRAATGTDVMAMNSGVVKIARYFTVYGNTVVIDHGLGVQTLYMHMSKLDVKEGERVEKGQIIGQSGDTGYADAPHLHISVKINSISIDPAVFLKFFEK